MAKIYPTTKDIVKSIAKKNNLDLGLVKKVSDLYLNEIQRNVLAGVQVRLVGFGTFDVTKWKTPEIYDINLKRKVRRELKTVKFSPSLVLKNKVLG